MNFEVTVIEFPAKILLGMKVRTVMQNAAKDCPALWQTFGPRITELSPVSPGAYGISVMTSENDFDYWAAVEVAPGISVPDNMGPIEIPQGFYARCSVPSLEQLGPAYMFVYGPWGESQSEYAIDMNGLSFELYPDDWQPGAAFEIYAPVTKK